MVKGVGPLAGVKVIDFCAFHNGPAATMRMADSGAEVLMVEPLEGTPTRNVPSITTEEGYAWPPPHANPGKRSPPLHMTHPSALVPMDAPGVHVLGPMRVFGHDHAPHGHMHIKLDNVRVPKENILWGEGRGFEISQLRLGPGRIHHCMRSIGSAEKALDLILERGMNREAFGKQIINLGKNMETVSRARIEIEAMRMIVLKAAKAMDVMGNKEARIWVSMAKAMVPEKCCQIIDQAIQIHGATGVSQWSPLSEMYMQQRTLRLADGPDEVHHNVVARNEVNRYNQTGA